MPLRTPSAACAAAAALLLQCAQETAARPEYIERIPNGANVPGVAALGHTNNIGGGATNAFGDDFAAANYKWTKALCEKDSDGDGQTNGQELGDPCCEWVHKSSQRLEWVDGVSSPADATKKSDPTRWAKINCTSASATSPSAAAAAANKVPSPSPASSASSAATAAAAVVAVAVAAAALAL